MMERKADRNENQKGGRVEGGLLSEEALESSKSLLDKTRNGGEKGAQQYYSPEELATFVARLMGQRIPVFDPTAGDGSLLKQFDPGYSYGVELDKDQVENADGSYKSIIGDFQHVYDLLRKLNTEFEGIVANPPFDLRWSEPSINQGEEMSSTKLTFIALHRLLTHDGQYVFICGKNRWEKECAELEEADSVYAILDVPDLFPDVTIPCVVVCGIADDSYINHEFKKEGPRRREFSRSTLDLAATWAQETRTEALGRYGHRLATYSYSTNTLQEAFPAIQKEYDQRLKERLGKYERKFDFTLGDKRNQMKVAISPYAKLILSRTGDLGTLERLHNHNLSYFRQNEAAWRLILESLEDGLISVEPALVAKVDALLADNRKIAAPLYGLKAIQSLGYLDQYDRIQCVRGDKERGFLYGERYAITVRPTKYEDRETRFEANKRTGEWQQKTFLQQKMRLRIQISNEQGHYQNFYDDEDSQADIQYLIDHFDIRPPKDIAELFPEEVHAMRALISDIEWDTIIPNSAKYLDDPEITAAIEKGELEYVVDDDPNGPPYGHKPYGIRLRRFQREDLARGLVKGNFICAWEQGLGKTLAALVYAEALRRLGRSSEQNLFIVPQDLVDQWQRECERFLGRKMEAIRPTDITIQNPNYGKVKRARKQIKHTVSVQAIAADVARRMKAGESGWFVTYHEALSTIGTKNEELPHFVVKEIPRDPKFIPGQYIQTESGWEWTEGRYEDQPNKQLWSYEICPKCEATLREGYNGSYCNAKLEKTGKRCGYTHTEVRVKPAASYLTTAFQRGTIVVDEITMIGCSASGDESLRSKAVRGLRAKNKLGMTGTPIKNYITQLYWLLRWVIDSDRFGYSWGASGWNQFISDFAVIEWDVSKGTKQAKKAKPEITNLSMLWRTLAACLIRRRQEETGEPIVPIHYHEHFVPLGVKQREQMQVWMRRFHEFFAEKYPDSKVVKANMHEALAPMLGMQPKLEYAVTLPLADPDNEWTGIEVSNWTPSNLRVLELAMALAKEGRKVLVGSATKETGRWLADQLIEKGVRAEHILEDDGTTFSAGKRAKVVHKFQTDDVQVFCAGVQAIRLGHNLDAGSAVIIHGMPWDWETFSQFVHRVRRLTSKRAIDCHIVLPHGAKQTITEKKWELLQAKGQASELALDGRLIPKDADKIDKDAVMKELVEKGITASADEIAEYEVEAAWGRLASYEDYVAPPNFTTGKQVAERLDPWETIGHLYEPYFRLNTTLALPLKASEARTNWGDSIIDTETSEQMKVEIGIAADGYDEGYIPFAGIDPEDLDSGLDDDLDYDTDDTNYSDSSPVADTAEEEPEDLDPDPPPPTTSKTDLVTALRELASLKSEGILDDAEFAEAKAALLAQLKEAA